MTLEVFWKQIEARIAKYDLLCHPFYKAWSEGKLTHEDLREYACDYYYHVEAFPTYLAEFAMRLEESGLRQAVLANLCDEKGQPEGSEPDLKPHSELWLDFAEGMGANRNLYGHQPPKEIKELITYFSSIAREGSPAEALAAFYAYESQVPRVAKTKAEGLRESYAADEKTAAYFTLHQTADLHHAEVWREQLSKQLEDKPEAAALALDAAEDASKALWNALDGIDARLESEVAA